MIHLFIGEGEGKTSASAGLAIRAAGHGFPVLFAQFLKDDASGEVAVLRRTPGVRVLHAPVDYGFTYQMTPEQLERSAKEYDKLLDEAQRSDAFLIVLDEVLHALGEGLVMGEKLEKLLEKDREIVLTGRNAPQWLIDRADYVSEIRKIKHPFDKGRGARIGIEF